MPERQRGDASPSRPRARPESRRSPRPILLDSGWEVREEQAPPAEPQPAPPDESEEGQEATGPPRLFPRAAQLLERWRSVRVPSVFDPDARPELFGGSVTLYRLRFTAPATRAFRWAVRFEQARRRTIAFLNGRRIGISIDPYTPFEFEAKGLRPGRPNTLTVRVDSRKDPRLPEGWWNWGGITRPVTLVPRGQVHVRDLGVLSDVTCKGAARRRRANVLVGGSLSKLPGDRLRGKRGKPGPLRRPTISVRLRSSSGRVTIKRLTLRGSSRGARGLRHLAIAVPAPKLWSPDRPQLYDARVAVSYQRFDILGINQYFGWYPWVADFNLLDPFLREMRDNYPNQALVMTEFGAEGRPDMAGAPAAQKGSYAFQSMHVARTLAVVERLPFLSGAIYWTLREFEIFPGWGGGAPLGPGRNTRHHKGVLTYTGERKPAWAPLHEEFVRTPMFAERRRPTRRRRRHLLTAACR